MRERRWHLGPDAFRTGSDRHQQRAGLFIASLRPLAEMRPNPLLSHNQQLSLASTCVVEVAGIENHCFLMGQSRTKKPLIFFELIWRKSGLDEHYSIGRGRSLSLGTLRDMEPSLWRFFADIFLFNRICSQLRVFLE